jgi:hypothetical protein
MGILKAGILGPIVNKTGPTTSRMHRGINVATAAYRTKKRPATALQSDSRKKFGLLNGFLRRVEQLISVGFKHFAKGKDPINVAFSYNFEHAFVIGNTGIQLNYPALMYSRGYILAPESPTVLALPAQIEFNWLPQPQSAYCQFTDLATFMVYNPKKKQAFKKVLATDRYAQGYLLDLPQDFIGHKVHCYMSFASKDGKLQGNSIYIGEVTCIA